MDRRWHAGASTGYYDSRGRWMPTGASTMQESRGQITDHLAGGAADPAAP